MAKTFTAAFAQTPKTFKATATTAFALTGANSLLDDLAQNTVLVCTAGADGALVTDISIIPRATVSTHVAAIFIRKSGDGGTHRKLLGTVAVGAQTVTTTQPIVSYTTTLASESYPLRLEAGDELYAGLTVTQTNGVNFHVRSVDY